ncbi:MAG: hypothetical protein KJN64_04695 [Ignavibacteria bacterium]|nr:hypothetical protein [Ignavibacteria bacterium]
MNCFNSYFFLFLIFIAGNITAQSESSFNANFDLSRVEGVWIIDLRPTPDSEPYLKEFVIENIEGNSFSGIFYDTDFENGSFNLSWDKLYFAFTTKDASSTYFHSGYVEEETMYGISFSPERSFTAPWNGKRK